MNPSPEKQNPLILPIQRNSLAILTDLEKDSWERLSQSLYHKEDRSAGPGFRFMILATRNSRGADARMVVNRRVDIDRKYVWFYTDARTEKVLQLEAFPMATLLFWNEAEQLQLRQTVETRLHTNDYIADEHWETVKETERKMYLSAPTPGTRTDTPYPGFPEHLATEKLSADEQAAARMHFAVIECRVLCMEYLQLSKRGQTRACFQYEPETSMAWLAP